MERVNVVLWWCLHCTCQKAGPWLVWRVQTNLRLDSHRSTGRLSLLLCFQCEIWRQVHIQCVWNIFKGNIHMNRTASKQRISKHEELNLIFIMFISLQTFSKNTRTNTLVTSQPFLAHVERKTSSRPLCWGGRLAKSVQWLVERGRIMGPLEIGQGRERSWLENSTRCLLVVTALWLFQESFEDCAKLHLCIFKIEDVSWEDAKEWTQVKLFQDAW